MSSERGSVPGRVLLAALVVLALLGGALGGLVATGRLDVTDDPDPTATASRTPAPEPAGPVLAAAGTSSATALAPTALDRVLRDADLGPAPGASVVDVASGETLLDRDGSTGRTPASVAKLLTGAAALTALDPQSRLTTRTVTGARPDEVVLVGAGDPTLTTRRRNADEYPRPATLAALARATAATLRAQGVATVSVAVDDSLFTGPAVSPDWRSSYVPIGVVSPVSALSVDAGRTSPDSSVREQDPAVAAGETLATLLAAEGLSVRPGVARAVAPPAPEGASPAPTAPGTRLAEVRSPTVADLVEIALVRSDNDVAEALWRLAAIGAGEQGSFEGGQAVLDATLDGLGVPTTGLQQLDGSGLARGSRVSPTAVTALLALAAKPDGVRLRPLLTGLPVAAFSGTLDDRFDAAVSRAGAGVVRAKTGTLSGVSSLAGLVQGPGDRLVVFAVLANDVPPASALGAEDALDRFAASLARTG